VTGQKAQPRDTATAEHKHCQHLVLLHTQVHLCLLQPVRQAP
jgi:hypothetical protein